MKSTNFLSSIFLRRVPFIEGGINGLLKLSQGLGLGIPVLATLILGVENIPVSVSAEAIDDRWVRAVATVCVSISC